MTYERHLVIKSLVGTILAVATTALGQTSIKVEPTQPAAAINPRLYGVFLEEINTAIDGGLYAELIRNRGFEESKPPEGFVFKEGRWVNKGGYATDFHFRADHDLPYWHVITRGGCQANLTLDLSGNLTRATPRAAKLTITNTGDSATSCAGIANEGYWGIAANAGETYDLTYWVKSNQPYPGKITATLEDYTGNPLSKSVPANVQINGQWQKITTRLTATRADPKARLVILASEPGTLWFDMVSLFPTKTFKGRPNGMRRDIAQMIADLKPGFARFPGGCVVEGATIETAYDWKSTLGPIENRPEAWNVWDYRRTHGMGYLEYLQFIEDIGAEPMFVASAGQMCIFRAETDAVPMQQMQPLANNFLDAIEYANGDATSPWGQKRIQAGRQKPFNLKMLEIGNENVGKEYLDRYAFIYPQIKQKYPDSLVLACIPHPDVKTEMVDEHYYSSPSWFINNEKLYNDRDRRDPPVYIAEVAVTTDEAGRDRGNLRAALAEGVFLMGCERNGDVVQMVSYAPLLANVDGRTPLAGSPPPWHGMIYFDSSRVFGTVSYHLWKLFGNNVPTRCVKSTVVSADENLPVSGGIGLGTWGTSAEFKDVKVEKDGQVLFASDFSKSADNWKTQGGRWGLHEGAFRQSRLGIGFARIGDDTWSNYTLSLKAKKLEGPEGFIIMFGSKGTDRLWWNLGGWGNREHGLELEQAAVGSKVPGQIESGRWYDIKIKLADRNVECYLDGVLVHKATIPLKRTLHCVAGMDEVNDELVIKVINTASKATDAVLDIGGSDFRSAKPHVTLLTSTLPTDNNSLDEPSKVAPRVIQTPPLAENPSWTFPANSLTLIRIKR